MAGDITAFESAGRRSKRQGDFVGDFSPIALATSHSDSVE
jgi:hypothetical protein